MKKIKMAALAFATPLAFGLSTAAQAGNPDGKFQVKLMGTAVLPDGEITSVTTDSFGLPAGSQTDVSDSYVPTLAVEYFISPNLSLETICCVTPHDVDGLGGIAGVELIEDAIVLPATVSVKYHVTNFDGFKPYVGAGLAHFFIFSENVGSGAAGLGITDVDLSDEFGFALQTGFDVPVNDTGWMFSVDAKRYLIDTTATFTAGGVDIIQTEHDLDPWVVSVGFGYRF